MNTAQEAKGDKTSYKPKHYANSPFPSTKGRFHRNHSFLSLMESIYQETVLFWFFFWFIISRRHLREEYLPTYYVPKFYHISETIVHTITHMFMHVIHNKVFRNVLELPQDQNDKASHVSCVLLSDSNLTKFPSSPEPIPLLPRLTLCYIFIFSASKKMAAGGPEGTSCGLKQELWCPVGAGKGKGLSWESKEEERHPFHHLIRSVWCLVLSCMDLPWPVLFAKAMSGMGMGGGNKIIQAKMPVSP